MSEHDGEKPNIRLVTARIEEREKAARARKLKEQVTSIETALTLQTAAFRHMASSAKESAAALRAMVAALEAEGFSRAEAMHVATERIKRPLGF